MSEFLSCKIKKLKKFGMAAALTGLCILETACGATNEEKILPEVYDGKITVSEYMSSNTAVLKDSDGDFSDWIELINLSDEELSLAGWRIADKEDKEGWVIPERSIAPGESLLLFASGKDRAEDLHTDFSLSAKDTICIWDGYGREVFKLKCRETEKNCSMSLNEKGEYEQSLYPTPGYENSGEGYQNFEASKTLPGPIIINEITVGNISSGQSFAGGRDWIEIKNISEEPVELSDYSLSDNAEKPDKWRFPEGLLMPGEIKIVVCGHKDKSPVEGYMNTDFSLDSCFEQLYLIKNGEISDYVFLRDIPYRKSYGRIPGENGWFYMEQSPGKENDKGFRRVSQAPVILSGGGVYNDTEKAFAELGAKGKIYYSLDGSVPDENSILYEGPIEAEKTSVVRAVSIEENAMPSRVLDISFIINENHSLPVLSLVSDSVRDFNTMYDNSSKSAEVSGSLSLYDEGQVFNIPCGFKMHGQTSLVLPKKNLSVKLRGCYGLQKLNCDIYGGGVTEFTDFVLRSGQAYYDGIVKNELCQNLALQSSDSLVSQRSKYCVLYINGRYSGIYALMEKPNEQHYSSLAGVSRKSVTVYTAPITMGTALYDDVLSFCMNHDMRKDENYQRLQSVLDIDSLIDWLIMEGYTTNRDLGYGNLRYCHSDENDGKWRLMFYDLDAAFASLGSNFSNVFGDYEGSMGQFTIIVKKLIKNPEFKDRFLKRAAELLNTSLSNENVLAELHRLCDEIEPEVARDYNRFGFSADKWYNSIERLEKLIGEDDWRQHNIDSICTILGLGSEERAYYFG